MRDSLVPTTNYIWRISPTTDVFVLGLKPLTTAVLPIHTYLNRIIYTIQISTKKITTQI